jgi:hypothetical protein
MYYLYNPYRIGMITVFTIDKLNFLTSKTTVVPHFFEPIDADWYYIMVVLLDRLNRAEIFVHFNRKMAIKRIANYYRSNGGKRKFKTEKYWHTRTDRLIAKFLIYKNRYNDTDA